MQSCQWYTDKHSGGCFTKLNQCHQTARIESNEEAKRTAAPRPPAQARLGLAPHEQAAGIMAHSI